MGDVGKGSAVDERGGVLQGLDQVRLDGVLQEGGHGSLGLQVMGGDRLVIPGIGHDHAGQAGLQIGQAGGQAQNCHDLGGHRDVESVLTGHAVGLAAQAADDVAQLTVIHIHRALPGDLAHVDIQRIALLNVVIQHGGQQVVGRADGVEVTGEVEVDLLHGDHLGISTAGRAALHTEHGAQAGLAQAENDLFAQLIEGIGQSHTGGGLTLACRRGVDGGHQHQLGLSRHLSQGVEIQLGLGAAIGLQHVLGNSKLGGHFCDGQHFRFLRDFDIRFHRNTASFIHVRFPFVLCNQWNVPTPGNSVSILARKRRHCQDLAV